MTSNGDSSFDLPPPNEAEDIIDFEVGAAEANGQPAVWVRLVSRNESGHSTTLCVGWMPPEVALRLSHGIRDIAVDLLS